MDSHTLSHCLVLSLLSVGEAPSEIQLSGGFFGPVRMEAEKMEGRMPGLLRAYTYKERLKELYLFHLVRGG